MTQRFKDTPPSLCCSRLKMYFVKKKTMKWKTFKQQQLFKSIRKPGARRIKTLDSAFVSKGKTKKKIK